jgi:hypothetical protein
MFVDIGDEFEDKGDVVSQASAVYRPAFFVFALVFTGKVKAFSISSGDFQNRRSCSGQPKRLVR